MSTKSFWSVWGCVTEFFLFLPFPPSVNGLYATDWKTKRRFKSEAYALWLIDAKKALDGQPKPEKPIGGEVTVEYWFTFPDKRKRDLMNYEKAVTDLLVEQGYLIDDSQIRGARLDRGDFSHPVSVRISEI